MRAYPELRAERLRSIALWLVVGLLVLGYILWQWEPMRAFAWKYDEGIYAMEARLQLHGYRLYTDVWSDRPPLFSMLVAVAFRLFGQSVTVGRTLVLALSMTGVIATAAIGRRVAGRLGALAMVALTLLLPHFYGISAMLLIELPPISLALAAMAAVLVYRDTGKMRWLVLSAVCFAGSGLIKPITAPMYLPLSLVLLLGATGLPGSLWQRTKRWLTFNLTMALPVLLMILLLGPSVFLRQVVGTLLELRGEHAYSLAHNLATVSDYLFSDKWGLSHKGILALAILALVSLAIDRRWPDGAALGSWLAVVLAALLLHTPLRRHHLFGLMPPLVVLSGVAIQDTWRNGQHIGSASRSRRLFAVLLVFGVGLLVVDVPNMVRVDIQRRANTLGPRAETLARLAAVEYLSVRTPPGSTIITDDPMLAFKSGRLIPPDLAAPSYKRVEAGELTPERLARLSREH